MLSKTRESVARHGLNILMYHSISRATGPTNVPPDTFKAQMDVLSECGYTTISLAAFKAWHSENSGLPKRPIVITFDDGFADFAETAFPILMDHHYTATVFLPSGRMGKTEDWDDSDAKSGRRLMTWAQVVNLARENVDFGGHSVTHRDLTTLSDDDLEREVRNCRDEIGEKLGELPVSFAPPYGKCGTRENAEIRKWFAMSLGTRLARAGRNCDLYDIPRIEMHYFRDLRRWRNFLEGRAESYFTARRALRGLRSLGKGV